ncbi:FAD assembly factor SdhE [Xanthobacter pseudotagetidis]|uniref:FAD assembly factor SdhE n=1 Tax=Xanthobacter pseudotagetidis TaxID=3119911 RepID=UPI003726B511
MSGTSSGLERSSSGLDERRRRILFRARHRGMREMDFIMGRFVDAEVAGLAEPELDELEILLDAQDQEVFSWICGTIAVPAERDTPFFRRLKDFHLSGRGRAG